MFFFLFFNLFFFIARQPIAEEAQAALQNLVQAFKSVADIHNKVTKHSLLQYCKFVKWLSILARVIAGQLAIRCLRYRPSFSDCVNEAYGTGHVLGIALT